MGEYKISKARSLGHEGGFSNARRDRGKRTWQGASEVHWGKKYPRIFAILDEAKACYPSDFKAMEAWLYSHKELADLIDHFYLTEFWNKHSLASFKWQTICDKIFDMAVNCGVGEAGYVVQRALNMANRNEVDWPDIKEDGHIGTKQTIPCLEHLIAKRGLFKTEILLGMEHFHTYRTIVRNDPEQEVHFWGWFNRLLTFMGNLQMEAGR